jgi:hypothetical protein
VAKAAEGPAANAAEGIAPPVLLIDTQDVLGFCAERQHKQIINQVSIGARREG